ncbi:GspH/FimT family pseudopilin [Bacillus sp. NP157]|nr:GspH/FimT family pseudopilin [Bacillus sp. NP157]
MRARGFTLFEMLAVIVLIGLAAVAVSIPVTQGLASARVNAASGELAAALRYTRTQAIVKGESEALEVNIATATYRVPGKPDVRLPRDMRVSITSAREDQANATTGRIRFFPDGSSTGGRITLKRDQREWHVNVGWLTGGVSIVVPK